MIARYLCLAVVGGAIASIVGAQRTPTPTPATWWLSIDLAVLADTNEQIAVIDRRAFRTLEALQEYIATLPPNAHISFRTYYRPPGENKFAAAAEQIKKWCDQHRIRMMLRTRPAEE